MHCTKFYFIKFVNGGSMYAQFPFVISIARRDDVEVAGWTMDQRRSGFYQRRVLSPHDPPIVRRLMRSSDYPEPCWHVKDPFLSITLVRGSSSKQNRCTEGCSKLKRSVDMTSSRINGLNIRTNASPKRDRTIDHSCGKWTTSQLNTAECDVKMHKTKPKLNFNRLLGATGK